MSTIIHLIQQAITGDHTISEVAFEVASHLWLNLVK
jgi:hypothetical protein